MKAVKATVAAVALSLALSVGGAVLSPTEPASAAAPRTNCPRQPGLVLQNYPYAFLGAVGSGWWNIDPGACLNFSRANLVRAVLTQGVLNDVNLSGANLTGAFMAGVLLNRANLSGANLTGAFMGGVSLIRANLSGANLSGVLGYGSAQKKGAIFSKTTICPNGKKYGTSGANC